MTSSCNILLTLTHLLFLLPSTLSKSTIASTGPINITAILIGGSQFTLTYFLHLLNQTRVLDQLSNQVNHSNQGMTIFAPTNNAFLSLPSGTLNGLSEEMRVKLVLNHVLLKYYSLDDLDVVSNPVPTRACGDHGCLGLYFSGGANQLNVSTGLVEAKISNVLRKDFPFVVYVVDKVLVSFELTKAPTQEGSSSPPERIQANGLSSRSLDRDDQVSQSWITNFLN